MLQEFAMDKEIPETGCCPRFDPEPWQEKFTEWTGKRFIKDSVWTFFHIPLNFGKVIRRMDSKIRASGGKIQDWLVLSDHTSRWNMDLYAAVDREIPGARNVPLSGKYFSKVYEGPFQDTGKWCQDFESDLKSRNMSVRKWYMWYTTCPACAKVYGKNYVVILSEIEPTANH